MSILVTGGNGFIGSHTVVELLASGRDIVVLDNFSNSRPEVMDRVEKITGRRAKLYKVNLTNENELGQIFETENIEAVIHFAAHKAVGESMENPLKYYHNNLVGTLNLLRLMNEFGVRQMIFSSSATVYGDKNEAPFSEDMEAGLSTNPYGETKVMIEKILTDLYESDRSWSITMLRYFNPIGAHSSGLIGEDPSGVPNNLVPYVAQVAIGKLEQLSIYGDDYDTPDGTGVRDYIHVVDLAKGHLRALEKSNRPGLHVYNLGTGAGYSVLELISVFEKVNGVKIPYRIAKRRAGDVAKSYANPAKANSELGWRAELGLEDMLRDAWNWQNKNRSTD